MLEPLVTSGDFIIKCARRPLPHWPAMRFGLRGAGVPRRSFPPRAQRVRRRLLLRSAGVLQRARHPLPRHGKNANLTFCLSFDPCHPIHARTPAQPSIPRRICTNPLDTPRDAVTWLRTGALGTSLLLAPPDMPLADGAAPLRRCQVVEPWAGGYFDPALTVAERSNYAMARLPSIFSRAFGSARFAPAPTPACPRALREATVRTAEHRARNTIITPHSRRVACGRCILPRSM